MPKAFFNRSHQTFPWPSDGHTFENWSVARRSFTGTRWALGLLIGTTDVPAISFISLSPRSAALLGFLCPSPPSMAQEG